MYNSFSVKEPLKECISKFVNPLFLAHNRVRTAIEKVLMPLISSKATCLDVGCGERPFEYLFHKGCYVGVDIENSGRSLHMKKPDYFYDGEILPFENESFDLVLSTQVLEHVPNPQKILNEMARVCKKGGFVVVSLPFVYQEHEEPYDFFRFTQFGINELLEKSGLKSEKILKDSSALETIAVIFSVYIIHNFIPKNKFIGYMFTLFLLLPVQYLAMLLSKIFPDNGQLYLNNIVLAKKTLNPC